MDNSEIAFGVGIALCLASGILAAVSKLAFRKTAIMVALLGLSGITLMVLFPFILRPRYSAAVGISQIVYFHGKGGKTLLVYNMGGASDRQHSLRLEVLNAETGEVLGKEVTGFAFRNNEDKTKLITIVDDKVWFYDYTAGLHARDPYSGKVVLTQNEIIERYPQLKSATKTEVKTEDGYIFQVRPPNFWLEMKSHPESMSNTKDSTGFPFTIDNNFVEISGPESVCLKNNDREDPQVMQFMRTYRTKFGYKVGNCLNDRVKLREAFFINNSGLSQPKSLMVGHREIDSVRSKKFVLTRIDMNGKIIWDIAQETLGGEPNLFIIRNGTLYMAINGTVVAVDTDSGKKKWETQL